MHEDEGIHSARGDEVGSNDGLASAWRRDENANVLAQHRIGGLALPGRQLAAE